MDTHAATQIFERYRPLLFSIAYRMLGSVMEAEDIVQETYLRYEATPPETIRSPKAFLSTITTRLCLDQLKSARMQREEYIGPWLPEPLLTDRSPAAVVREKETISMAFLVLLEKLSPVERAVFLLREVFDYGYDEIAAMVEKSAVNCRQLYSRAKKYLVSQRPRFEPPARKQEALINEFLLAAGTGDLDGLTQMLAADAVHWSDGGGKAAAARKPIVGRERIARFFVGLARQAPEGFRAEITEANGECALLMWIDDLLYGVMTFTVVGDKITGTHAVLNPDKLQHLNAPSTAS